MDRRAPAFAVVRDHWFYLLLPFALLASSQLRASLDWSTEGAAGEAVILFDWCVFLPALYAAFLRRTVPARALLVRVVGAACLGLWIAELFVPNAAERFLRDWSRLRYVGLAALFALEAAALIAVVRLLLAERPDAAELEKQGVPPLVARLMLLEARFWRWLWIKTRGR